MTVICHSNRLESSTRPAEKPSTGFLASSVLSFVGVRFLSVASVFEKKKSARARVHPAGRHPLLLKKLTPQLLLQQQGRVVRHLFALCRSPGLLLLLLLAC